MCFSANDDMLAIGFLSGVVVLRLQPASDGTGGLQRVGDPIHTPDAHQSACLTCDFDPVRNDVLASAGLDGNVYFWQITRKGSVHELYVSFVSSLCFFRCCDV
jgi:WD40 repeat protein